LNNWKTKSIVFMGIPLMMGIVVACTGAQLDKIEEVNNTIVKPVATAVTPVNPPIGEIILGISNVATLIIAGLKTKQSNERGKTITEIDSEHTVGAESLVKTEKSKRVIRNIVGE